MYRFHDDIVYTRVSGISILVTLRNSWDRFPAVKELSPIQGCFCQGIDERMSEDELIEAIRLPEKSNKEILRRRYRAFVREMAEEGYLVPEGTTHES